MVEVKRTTSFFQYDKKSRLLVSSKNVLGISHFPSALEVISTETGRIVKFFADNDAAERNEFWDGEMMEYYTRDTDINRLRLVINAWGDDHHHVAY